MQNQKTNELILAAACIVLLLLVGVTAVSIVPAIEKWVATQQQASEETPLQLRVTTSDRRNLSNGREMVALTGRIANPTDRRVPVPPLIAELRGYEGRVIHKWTIQPPVAQLDANTSVEFRHMELDVPPKGDQLTLTIGSP